MLIKFNIQEDFEITEKFQDFAKKSRPLINISFKHEWK